VKAFTTIRTRLSGCLDVSFDAYHLEVRMDTRIDPLTQRICPDLAHASGRQRHSSDGRRSHDAAICCTSLARKQQCPTGTFIDRAFVDTMSVPGLFAHPILGDDALWNPPGHRRAARPC